MSAALKRTISPMINAAAIAGVVMRVVITDGLLRSTMLDERAIGA